MDITRLDRSPPSLAIVSGLVATGLLIAGAISGNVHFLLGAILPASLAILSIVTRAKETRLIIGPDDVRDEYGEILFHFRDIVGLTINGASPSAVGGKYPSGSLQIRLPEKTLVYRQLSAATTQAVYQEILSRIPASGSRSVCHELQARLQQELATFDDDLVSTYRTRTNRTPYASRLGPLFFALLFSCIAWIGFGSAQRVTEDWVIVGMIGLMITIFGRLLLYAADSSRGASQKLTSDCSLIISPRGVAMLQGPLKGQLSWSEVRGIECGKVHNGTLAAANTSRTIMIKVEGSTFPIHDIYDRPLAKIHEGLMKFWKPKSS